MKAIELRKKTTADLEIRLVELRKEVLNLRFQRVSGQIESTAGFRNARREIARIKTIIAEQSLQTKSNNQGASDAS